VLIAFIDFKGVTMCLHCLKKLGHQRVLWCYLPQITVTILVVSSNHIYSYKEALVLFSKSWMKNLKSYLCNWTHTVAISSYVCYSL